MENDEGFRQAFATIERYEKYKLARTTGILILVIGLGRFLLSWIIDQTFLISLNLNYETGVNIVFFFRLVVQIILILTLILILVFSYISTKKTSISQGGEIISLRDIQFLVMVCILIYLTFFLRLLASIYFEEVLGVFICYFIFKRGIKIDLKELLHLGIVLLAISIIELIGRILIVVFLFNHQLFVPIWTTFYIGIAITFMIPYLIMGRRIFKNASSMLEEG